MHQQAGVHGGAPLDGVQPPLQGAQQSFLLQHRRSQLVDQYSHLFERLVDRVANAAQIVLRLTPGPDLGQAVARLGKEAQAVQQLSYRVVQFSRQPPALLYNDCPLGLPPQTVVLHRHRYVVGDRGQQRHLFDAELLPCLPYHAEHPHYPALDPHGHANVGKSSAGVVLGRARVGRHVWHYQRLAVLDDPGRQAAALYRHAVQ